MKINYLFFIFLVFFLLACGSASQEPTAEDHSQHRSEVPKKNLADVPNGMASYIDSVNAELKPDSFKGSPRRETTGNIGDLAITINYGSPGVKGRNIWGGLVGYDQVWVTGAHKATAINFSKDVMIEGQRVPAGTYAFFTIPNPEAWTVILNKNYQQHLADDYKETEDILRLKVKPEVGEKIWQRLQYEVLAKDNHAGVITMTWEKIKIALEVKVSNSTKTNAL
jgi:hypothetical protein